MSVFVAKELSEVLNTKVVIGRINIGLLNRIIIDDVLLDDQSGQEMLKVTRLSAKFDIMPFFKGKISISSVQLFGFNIDLRKETPESPPNFKFVLDAFASKDTVKRESSLDLRINSILIRRGRMSYHVLSEQETPGKFNAKHIQLQNIIANISLKALSKDSLNLGIKRLSLDEKASGFSLKKMRLSSQHSPECRSCFRGPEMTSMDCSCLMRSDASSPMAAVIRILISHPSLPIRPEPFRLSRMMERCPHLSGLSMTAAVPFYSRYPDISSGFLVSKYVMCCNAYLAAKMSGHS